MQTLTSRSVGDAAAGLGLHFLHMSEGPFSHDAGHMLVCVYIIASVVIVCVVYVVVIFHREFCFVFFVFASD